MGSTTLTQVKVTVTADDAGGQPTFTISKSKIKLDKGSGGAEIEFKIDDQTKNGPAVFDCSDPICYSDTDQCPPRGTHDSSYINISDCRDSKLTIEDSNDNVGELTIGYRLNFLYGGQRQQESLDPIIINGGR